MKAFLISILGFFCLLAVICVIPVYILFVSGELVPLPMALRMQMKDSGLIGYAYSYNDPALKLAKTNLLKPELLALGSSRIMQISSKYIHPDYSFYNAGGAVQYIKDFRIFLSKLVYDPKVIIINLDQMHFNKYWSGFYGCSVYDYKNEPLTLIGRNVLNVYKDLAKGKVVWDSLRQGCHVGLNARINHDGFQSDGTYYYGRVITNPLLSEDYQFRNTFQRIKEGNMRFEYCNEVGMEAVKELEQFLICCEKRSIRVVAYLAPYAPAVWKCMTQSEEYKGKYSYLTQINATLHPLFEKYHYPLFDFSDGGAIGSRDAEFIDGFHGSDKTYLRMMVEMARRDKTVGMYFRDTTQLNQLILKYPDINVAP